MMHSAQIILPNGTNPQACTHVISCAKASIICQNAFFPSLFEEKHGLHIIPFPPVYEHSGIIQLDQVSQLFDDSEIVIEGVC